MPEISESRMIMRTAIHRATVAVMCGSLEGEQRRSAWIAEQARLLGSEQPSYALQSMTGYLPRPRRAA
ncbi:MAG: hypothetical protein IPJ14_20080 [Kineosporiaceae bacterium]|nr:hypothetical protein [Kineosporiaceae bacterium]MBK7624889.1 hypothetical protein [Kineosporiaceae bacterium]MBK8076732.1 hypothetical protein [Kineosporiaceae bacterium]